MATYPSDPIPQVHTSGPLLGHRLDVADHLESGTCCWYDSIAGLPALTQDQLRLVWLLVARVQGIMLAPGDGGQYVADMAAVRAGITRGAS